MRKTALIIALIIIPAWSLASLTDNKGDVLAPKESFQASMKFSGDFGVQILTTLDENKTRAEWLKGTILHGSKTVRKGSRIYVMFIFTGAKPDLAGKCKIKAETMVIKPDGSVYDKIPAVTLWNDKPAPKIGKMVLGDAAIGLIIEREDLLGKYIVETVVKDEVSGSEVSLETDFEAVP